MKSAAFSWQKRDLLSSNCCLSQLRDLQVGWQIIWDLVDSHNSIVVAWISPVGHHFHRKHMKSLLTTSTQHQRLQWHQPQTCPERPDPVAEVLSWIHGHHSQSWHLQKPNSPYGSGVKETGPQPPPKKRFWWPVRPKTFWRPKQNIQKKLQMSAKYPKICRCMSNPPKKTRSLLFLILF